MALESMQDLFINELKDIYNAENQLLKALPRMAKAADAPPLRAAFEKHLRETEGQVHRLEQIFERLNEKPTGKRCVGMEGLVAEGKEIIDEKGQEAVLDAALIAAAQRVEHYEIAAYGCLRAYATLLGQTKAATLLGETLREEEAADQLLSKLAEGGVNEAALSASESSGDEE